MTDGTNNDMLADLLSRCDFPQAGTSVCCAVSGGPDSMALMVLAHANGLDVSVVHVDHQLRSDSASDIGYITPVADSLGIRVEHRVVTVEQGPNLEARAREARRAVLPPGAMTGHTADDQAETMFINLLRGAGAHGLAAMRPGRDKPLLGLRRSETHGLCSAMGITTVVDDTNTDSRFLRNRIRLELLPLITEISQRDPVPLLVRSAQVLRNDNDLLDELASALDPTDARALAGAPTALARRAIRQWLADPYPPDLATIERVLAVARGDVLACDIGQNREIRRHKQRLVVQNVG